MSERSDQPGRRARRPVNVRGASLRAVYIIWYRDVLRYWRDRWRVVASLAQPLLFLIIFGTGLSSVPRRRAASGAGIVAAVPAIHLSRHIGMAVLFTAIFGGMSIVWDREFGFLKEVLVAPINRSAVAIGKTLGSATQAMIQGLILLVLAPFVGVKLTLVARHRADPVDLPARIRAERARCRGGITDQTMQGFQVVMNFLMMPMFFLSGALFPLSGNLPGWMKVLTRLDPAAMASTPCVAWCSRHQACPPHRPSALRSPCSGGRCRSGRRWPCSPRSEC